MQHLKILAYLIILIVGVSTTVRIMSVNRTETRTAFRSLPLLLILFNIIVFINLTSVYTCANLLVNCLLYHSTFFPVVLGSAGRSAFLMMVFAITLIGLDLKNAPENASARKRVILSGITILPAYALLTALARTFPHIRPLVWIDISIFFLVLFLLLYQLSRIIRFGTMLSDTRRRKMIISFGTFYFASFILFVVSSSLPGNDPFILNTVTLLLCNLFPLVWFNHYSPVPQVPPVKAMELGDLMNEICARYNISNREREVAELILQGKSNQEIQDQLYISISTVKNHNYRLFRKLGINSRGQLASMVLQTSSSHSEG
ncbi:response regulator transcription factor [Candidatus Zixiibacteriota bacterium]